MTDQTTPASPSGTDRRERLFPRLTNVQLDRLLQQGVRRPTAAGAVLLDQGALTDRFFAVLSGDIEIVRPRLGGEELIVVHGPGCILPATTAKAATERG